MRSHSGLLKVGHGVSATAIRNLVRREKLGPAPMRSGLSRKAFLRAQASAIVVSDFCSVDTVLLRRLYVLLYMVLATRRVVWFAVTANPDTAWVTQQSRNLVWQLEGSPVRFVIHDHDIKYPRSQRRRVPRRGPESDQDPDRGTKGESSIWSGRSVPVAKSAWTGCSTSGVDTWSGRCGNGSSNTTLRDHTGVWA